MANTGNNVIREKQREMSALIAAAQDRIKARLYEHGMRKRIKQITGLSAYKIRTTVNSDNPDLQVLEKIEKALSSKKVAA